MKALSAPLWEMAEFPQIAESLQDEKKSVLLTGCVDSQKLHMIYGLSGGFTYKIIVTYHEMKAKELYEDYKFYDKNVIIFPGKDLIFYQADIHGKQLTAERMKCLKKILERQPFTLITTFDNFMIPQVPLDILKKSVLKITKQTTIDETELAKKLIEMGYEKNYQVEIPGQFSIRGGIIDIFDLTDENPFRIELWGDEPESIRTFDVLSQRSIEEKEAITVFPATEMILSDQQIKEGLKKIEQDSNKCREQFRKEFKTEEGARVTALYTDLKEQIEEFQAYANVESYVNYFYEKSGSLFEYLNEFSNCIFMDEPAKIAEHASAVELEFRESMIHRAEKGYILPKQMELLRSAEEVAAILTSKRMLALCSIDMHQNLFKFSSKFNITTRSVPSYNSSFENLLTDLKKYKKNGYRILLLSGSRTRAARLAEDILQEGMSCFYSEEMDRQILPGEVMTAYGHVTRGFEYPLLKYLVITDSDIFGNDHKKKKKRKVYEGQKIQDFSQLKVGDYVVHENHGLGIYQGIEKVEMNHVTKDYIKIQYRDGGNLYVLATGLDVIQKYASSDGKQVKLNKLGTQEWVRTKSKVKSAVTEVAKDLVELYAKRQMQEGFQFGPDTVWQTEFEEMFIYEETDDQLNAIEATKSDMQSSRIMDRLICGDVGYGKTEIAIRAAFKAVQDGKQVIFLVPTTILAQQHYNTFVQRMKDFPVRIDLMSRFRSTAEQKKTLIDLKKGMVDILIGTHRVLSKDILPKDLGLLIIDEEQRFGVTHKEKIKKMKDTIDVLTLTATPIPRTLHMSLVGIRDMSVLEEPPNDRMPIQTYIMEYNEEMVREAIVRELTREGQIYYVYNRVSNIADIAANIQKLVPEAVVAFAHGQMKEHELERIMYDFMNGEIDVLVSTTIIETGLDISNVNTMIIHDADTMGLSQLYQLRGRVGRSNRSAYAFLMYKKNKMIKEVAEKRLQAIREFTDLGSGFKIAMRDLEIRGAGNLLGEKQHGHMAAVGYDLYCKMLNEAVKVEKGISTQEDFNTSVELDVDAYIPPTYILNEFQKLDIYKRIAGVETQSEFDDMKEELLDRFGEIPKPADNLLRIAMIRANAHKIFITEVQGKEEVLKIVLKSDAPVEPTTIPILLAGFKDRLKFSIKGIPHFTYRYKKTGMVEKDAENLLVLTESLLQEMKVITQKQS